jgi:hypothetical protein
MYELQISTRSCRSDTELALLAGTVPTRESYDTLLDEDARVVVRSQGVQARLVRNGIPEKLVKTSAELFRTVRGDLSNRGNAVYRDSMMPRVKANGTISDTNAVPASLLAHMRQENGRLGLVPPETNFLGYFDKTPRTQKCRETAWTLAQPDIFAISEDLAREVERVNKSEHYDSWKRQRDFMRQVSSDFKYHNSIYSTMTVNLNVNFGLHIDSGDFTGGMGNLVVLELGHADSGILVMPRTRVAFLVRPTDVLLMNVHDWHGNRPLTESGTRLTAVLYARERIDRCR